jgi:hypothetical protein
MNLSWVLLFLTPLTTLASYPVYDEDVGSLQPELHISEQKKAPSAISKRDTPKRNAPLQSKKARPRHRQHPDRPRVIYRDTEKKPQDLSKIEAEADSIEEKLASTHPDEEREASPPSQQDSVSP